MHSRSNSSVVKMVARAFGLLVLMAVLHGPLQAQMESPILSRSSGVTADEEQPMDVTAYSWWAHLTWDSLWQETNVYAPDGKLMERIHDEYILFYGFQRHSRNFYDYDTLDRLRSVIQETWNGTSYTPFRRTMYYFDVLGHDSITHEFEWAQVVSGYDWDTVLGLRTVHEHGAQGIILKETFSAWTEITSGSYWQDQSKNEYHFSPQAEWDTITYYRNQFGTWALDGRRVGISWHDFASDQVAAYTTQIPNGGWTDVQRVGCSYNGRDSDCAMESFFTAWDSTQLFHKRYDAQGHLTLDETWNRNNNSWQMQSGQLYHYTYGLQGQTLEMYNEIWEPNLVAYRKNLKYVYGSPFVGIEDPEVPVGAVQVFPNPASDRITFVMDRPAKGPASIVLTDLQGRKRLECRSAAIGQEIELRLPSSLEAGSYIYAITSARGRATGRVILLGQ